MYANQSAKRVFDSEPWQNLFPKAIVERIFLSSALKFCFKRLLKLVMKFFKIVTILLILWIFIDFGRDQHMWRSQQSKKEKKIRDSWLVDIYRVHSVVSSNSMMTFPWSESDYLIAGWISSNWKNWFSWIEDFPIPKATKSEKNFSAFSSLLECIFFWVTQKQVQPNL